MINSSPTWEKLPASESLQTRCSVGLIFELLRTPLRSALGLVEDEVLDLLAGQVQGAVGGGRGGPQIGIGLVGTGQFVDMVDGRIGQETAVELGRVGQRGKGLDPDVHLVVVAERGLGDRPLGVGTAQVASV